MAGTAAGENAAVDDAAGGKKTGGDPSCRGPLPARDARFERPRACRHGDRQEAPRHGAKRSAWGGGGGCPPRRAAYCPALLHFSSSAW